MNATKGFNDEINNFDYWLNSIQPAVSSGPESQSIDFYNLISEV